MQVCILILRIKVKRRFQPAGGAGAAWTCVRRFKILDLRRGTPGLFPSAPRMPGRRAVLAARYLRFIELGGVTA